MYTKRRTSHKSVIQRCKNDAVVPEKQFYWIEMCKVPLSIPDIKIQEALILYITH